jgi:hypothetical protein
MLFATRRRCLLKLLEHFDGTAEVAFRLTVVPTKYFESWGQDPFSK